MMIEGASLRCEATPRRHLIIAHRANLGAHVAIMSRASGEMTAGLLGAGLFQDGFSIKSASLCSS
jgi:hypothetical protein